MNKEFNQKMKQKLIEMKSEILNQIIQEKEELREMVDTNINPKDVVEMASDDIDRKMIEKLGSFDFKRLHLIDAALARIETGTYGKCLKTGKQIPEERLEAIPYALYCIEVQQLMDHRRNIA